MIFAGYHLAGILLEYKAGTDEYDQLRDYTAAAEDGTDASETSPAEGAGDNAVQGNAYFPTSSLVVDFAALQQINPDVIGWIEIGSLDISYPIVQGADNSYYLHHTFQKQSNSSGAIFMDSQNGSGFQDANTIIYGHNMKNGAMFGKLKHYTSKNIAQQEPYFWIHTPEAVYTYQAFSVHTVSPESDAYTLFFGIPDQAFADWAGKMASESEVSLETPVFDSGNKIVTLSTCTSDGSDRYVVHGILCGVVNR